MLSTLRFPRSHNLDEVEPVGTFSFVTIFSGNGCEKFALHFFVTSPSRPYEDNLEDSVEHLRTTFDSYHFGGNGTKFKCNDSSLMLLVVVSCNAKFLLYWVLAFMVMF